MSGRDPNQTLRDLIGSGSFAEALIFYLDRSEALDTAESHYHGASAAARVGQYQLARSLAATALQSYRASGDDRGQVVTLNLQGGIELEAGDLAQAEQIFRKGVRLAAKLEDGGIYLAKLWNNLGSIVHLRGDETLAITFYNNALEAYRFLRDHRGIAQTTHNLSLRLASVGAADESMAYADLAVEHARLTSDLPLVALALMGRAERALDRNDWAAAEVDIQAALALALEARDHLGVAEGLRLKARVALAQGQFEQARREAESAYTQAVDLGASLAAADCTAIIALAQKALGNQDEAERRRADTVARLQELGAAGPLKRFLAEWAR